MADRMCDRALTFTNEHGAAMTIFLRRCGKDFRLGWQSDDEEQSIDITAEELAKLKDLLNEPSPPAPVERRTGERRVIGSVMTVMFMDCMRGQDRRASALWLGEGVRYGNP